MSGLRFPAAVRSKGYAFEAASGVWLTGGRSWNNRIVAITSPDNSCVNQGSRKLGRDSSESSKCLRTN